MVLRLSMRAFICCCVMFLGGGCQLWQDKPSVSEEAVTRAAKPAELESHFPQKPTAWATKVLLLTHEQPAPKDVQKCIEEVRAISAQASNPEELLTATERLKQSVATAPELYHWCFFRLSHMLDENMTAPHLSYQERGRIFLAEMQTLWVFARSLDAHFGKGDYFQFCRSRYVMTANALFGSHKAVLTDGLTTQKKPAGRYDEMSLDDFPDSQSGEDIPDQEDQVQEPGNSLDQSIEEAEP